jgi:hypothetical protein
MHRRDYIATICQPRETLSLSCVTAHHKDQSARSRLLPSEPSLEIKIDEKRNGIQLQYARRYGDGLTSPRSLALR